MKKVVKCLLLFTLCSLLLFSSTAFANSLNIEKVTSNVYGLLFKIGVILAVCLTVTLAISYMVATPNKKAMLKERLIYYFAGVIFLVGGLAFLNIYEGVSDDIGNTVYTDGAPLKIKDYFQNKTVTSSDVPSDWDTDGDGIFSQKEMHDNVSYDELDEIAQDAIDEGIENLTDAEIQLLITRLAGISEEEMGSLDFSPLFNNYDSLTKEQKEAIMGEGQLYYNMKLSSKEMWPAERDLVDFYRYHNNLDSNYLGYTDEQWEDPVTQGYHKWYYENVYLKDKE